MVASPAASRPPGTCACRQIHLPTSPPAHFSTYPPQLFGLDILLDSRLRAWLLEVNTSPSLAADSPLDERVKGAVVSDLM
jgi:hypothetical protein